MKSSNSKQAPSGWTFNKLTHWTYNSRKQINSNYKCSINSWFGLCSGDCIGSVNTKLRKCGKARLYYGNCGKGGCVEAKLNSRIIGRVGGNKSGNVEFDFKDGDLLELYEFKSAIIEFDDFKIISCTACPGTTIGPYLLTSDNVRQNRTSDT